MEAAVVMLREQRRGEPIAGPVAVEICASWPMPKTRPAWCSREAWASRKADSGLAYATKPDADNVAKIVLDAMVEAGVLADDRYVVSLTVGKRAVTGGGRVVVWVTPA